MIEAGLNMARPSHGHGHVSGTPLFPSRLVAYEIVGWAEFLLGPFLEGNSSQPILGIFPSTAYGHAQCIPSTLAVNWIGAMARPFG